MAKPDEPEQSDGNLQTVSNPVFGEAKNNAQKEKIRTGQTDQTATTEQCDTSKRHVCRKKMADLQGFDGGATRRRA